MSAASFIQVNARSVALPSPTGLTPLDYVALGVSVSVFVGYHLWLDYRSTHSLHVTLLSHVDLSRIAWTKYIYYDYKNKVTTIQTFRTALSVVAFFFSLITAAVVGLMFPSMRTWWDGSGAGNFTSAALRTVVPLVVLLAALACCTLTQMAYFHLHFHTQIEDVGDAEREKFFGPDVAAADIPSAPIKAATGVLATQCNYFFRLTWRLCVVGVVYLSWAVSPIALIALSLVVTGILYVNDFPFSGTADFVPRGGGDGESGGGLMFERDRGGGSEVAAGTPTEAFSATTPHSLETKRAELAAVFQSLP